MYDIAVIGSGPAGLSAAVQARARNRSVLVVGGDDRDNPLYKTPRIDIIWVSPKSAARSCWNGSALTPMTWAWHEKRAGY